jgi:hypothetical protein
MNITIKELSQEQIRQANNNSFGGKRGDITAHEYEVYCNRVVSWQLSEKKTQKIIDKVHEYFVTRLSLDAQHVSVAVAGASNYNAKRLDKSDKILDIAADFVDWFKEIEDHATKKPYSRIEWITKSIIWGVQGDYPVNKEWKELAGRSRKDFENLYAQLENKFVEFKKTSIPYKIKHNLIDVEQITQAPIYADDDFFAYEEQGKICISFRLKPQRQMIVALKSRHFVWVADHEVWKATATEELKAWVETIAERYEQHI